MNHPKLREANALVDDARCLLVDVVDERPVDGTPFALNHIDAARQCLNAAIRYIETAEKEHHV